MMSKTGKWIIALLIFLATAGWAWWQLKPKPAATDLPQEINIKQAQIPDIVSVTYEDWSGFKFNYPDILKVKEIELDNSLVYSSLELTGNDNNRLTIRVSDTQYQNLDSWQKNFTTQYSVRKISPAALGGLTALRVNYGAPEMTQTVAIENGIIYEINSQTDNGFWDLTHNDLVDSWQFTNIAADPAPAASNTNGNITLIEETLE